MWVNGSKIYPVVKNPFGVAETLFRKINVLILDEPTNHLDSYAREEIEEMLQDYQGTLLAVSHDRYFLQQHFQEALVIEQEQISRQPLGQLID